MRPKRVFMRYLKATIVAMVLVAASGISVLSAPLKLPAPTTEFYANDFADMLSSDVEQSIVEWGKATREATGAQVIVVTIPNLQGLPIENYALELGRKWGVGQKDKDNGVVLLVARDERKARIEVGYGLEGAIPDGKAGRILDETLIPSFRQGDYDGGISLSYKTILTEVYTEYGATMPEELANLQVQGSNDRSVTAELPEGLKTALGIAFFILMLILRWRFPRLFRSIIFMGGGRWGGGGGSGGSSGGGGGFGGGGSSRGW